MNKLVVIAVVLACSVVAFLVMYYLIGFGLNKSLIIAGGAALLMIIFDIVIPAVRRK